MLLGVGEDTGILAGGEMRRRHGCALRCGQPISKSDGCIKLMTVPVLSWVELRQRADYDL